MQRYFLSDKSSIKEALVALNNNSDDILALIIIDQDEKMVGTLTDGDIRRGLIQGVELSDCVTKIMRANFRYISDDKRDVSLIKDLKAKGIKLLPYLDKDGKVLRVYSLKSINSILPLDAVIMAGGKGERMRPMTLSTPKPLLKVGEKCIIDYNVDSLISYGIENINVTVNYLAEQIEEHYKQSINGVQVKCIREPKYLGTIGSIKFIDTFVNDTVLVMNSDLFTNINYEEFYLHFIKNNADMSVAAVPYTVNIPYGIFELEGRDIVGLKEKPTYNHYANAGIYLIKKNLLRLIPEDAFFNATDFIEKLISNNHKVVRFPISGYWIDIGKPADYQRAQDLVKHL